MDLNKQLKELLDNTLKSLFIQLDIEKLNYVIEVPKDNRNGDYASNVAMVLTKELHKNPRAIAEEITKAIDLNNSNFDKVEIAGPGFINFFVKQNALTDIIEEVIDLKENYGKSNFGKKERYDVEFVSANPTGKLHLGHARQSALGDSICRILKAAGYHVVAEYYVNDAGNQIHNLALSLQARYDEICGLKATLPEDGYHGQDVIDIAKKLHDEIGSKYAGDNSPEAYQYFRNKGVELELEQIKKDLSLYRVNMDVFTSEAAIRAKGMIERTLDIMKEANITYEQDGATWFASTKYGDDKDRVLIKSDGSYTYLVPDIAYHIDKLQRGFDKLVDIFGADHHGYITRLKATIKSLGYDDNKLNVDIVQMVRLIKDGEEFKMSKRTGNAISLTELIDEVGVDAARYFFVSRSGSTHLDFNINLAKSCSNDNPVYYAQYAHARMASILKASESLKLDKIDIDYSLINTKPEESLLKQIREFGNVIIEAAKTREPYKVANYTQHLAQTFHSFYNECRVIDENNLVLTKARLQLVMATKITLANALNLIGVSAPETM